VAVRTLASTCARASCAASSVDIGLRDGRRRTSSRPLLAELSECEYLADELSGRLGRREITLKRYDVAMVPLDKRIAELRASWLSWTACREQTQTLPSRPASREEWMARWNAATVAERRNLIRQALTNRRIVIAPAVRSGSPKFDPNRIRIEEVHYAE
jgi:hypothetical protein